MSCCKPVNIFGKKVSKSFIQTALNATLALTLVYQCADSYVRSRSGRANGGAVVKELAYSMSELDYFMAKDRTRCELKTTSPFNKASDISMVDYNCDGSLEEIIYPLSGNVARSGYYEEFFKTMDQNYKSKLESYNLKGRAEAYLRE